MKPLPDLDDLVVANRDQPLRELIADEEGRVHLAPQAPRPAPRRSIVDWANEVQEVRPSVRAAMEELSRYMIQSGISTPELVQYRDRFARGGMVRPEDMVRYQRESDPEAIIPHRNMPVYNQDDPRVPERLREGGGVGVVVNQTVTVDVDANMVRDPALRDYQRQAIDHILNERIRTRF